MSKTLTGEDGRRGGRNKQSHRGGKGGSNDITKAFAQAHGSEEFTATLPHHPDHPKQVTDQVEVTKMCEDMLRGVPGIYEFFGAKFEVMPHPHFPESTVIKFCGALYGCLIRDKIRLDTFIPVTKLFAKDPQAANYRNEDERVFVLYLLAQNEMVLAKGVVQQERHHAWQEEQAAKRQAELNELLGKAGTAKASPIELTRLGDIMKTSYGTFRHESGVTILVLKGAYDRIIIRVTDTADDHPMHKQNIQKVFIQQKHLDGVENSVALEGIAQLAREMRIWLRDRLRETGDLPAEVVAVTASEVAPADDGMPKSADAHLGTTADVVASGPSKTKRTRKPKTDKVPGVNSMKGVDTEHAAEEGAYLGKAVGSADSATV